MMLGVCVGAAALGKERTVGRQKITRERRRVCHMGERARVCVSCYLVDVLVATIVASAGEALGVLVGEARAEGLHHGRRGEVLGGDQLNALAVCCKRINGWSNNARSVIWAFFRDSTLARALDNTPTHLRVVGQSETSFHNTRLGSPTQSTMSLSTPATQTREGTNNADSPQPPVCL